MGKKGGSALQDDQLDKLSESASSGGDGGTDEQESACSVDEARGSKSKASRSKPGARQQRAASQSPNRSARSMKADEGSPLSNLSRAQRAKIKSRTPQKASSPPALADVGATCKRRRGVKANMDQAKEVQLSA